MYRSIHKYSLAVLATSILAACGGGGGGGGGDYAAVAAVVAMATILRPLQIQHQATLQLKTKPELF